MEKTTGIVIIVFNRMEAALRCIESVLTDAPDGSPIVVVDNSSTDGIRKFLPEFQRRCTIILSRKNQGLGRASNIGFRKARALGAQDVIRINGDIRVLPGWFESLVSVAALPDAGVVGPTYTMLSIGDSQRITEQGVPGSDVQSKTDYLSGHCLLIPDRMWKKGFRWERSFRTWGPDNLDACLFSRWMKLSNYVAMGAQCMLVPCAHSTKWTPGVDIVRCLESGRKFLKRKWSGRLKPLVM